MEIQIFGGIENKKKNRNVNEQALAHNKIE